MKRLAKDEWKYLLTEEEDYQKALKEVQEKYPNSSDPTEPPASLPAVAHFYTWHTEIEQYIEVFYTYLTDFDFLYVPRSFEGSSVQSHAITEPDFVFKFTPLKISFIDQLLRKLSKVSDFKSTAQIEFEKACFSTIIFNRIPEENKAEVKFYKYHRTKQRPSHIQSIELDSETIGNIVEDLR